MNLIRYKVIIHFVYVDKLHVRENLHVTKNNMVLLPHTPVYYISFVNLYISFESADLSSVFCISDRVIFPK